MCVCACPLRRCVRPAPCVCVRPSVTHGIGVPARTALHRTRLTHHLRSTLVSLKEAMIVVGMLFGYIVGFCMEHTHHGWMITYGVSVFPAVIMFFGVSSLPNSARWLALTGRLQQAQASLEFVYAHGAEDIVREIAAQTMTVSTKVFLSCDVCNGVVCHAVAGVVHVCRLTPPHACRAHAGRPAETPRKHHCSAVPTAGPSPQVLVS